MNADWAESAPWRQNVQSARRARRDGLKVVTAVAVVAALMAAFAQFGEEDSQSGFGSQVAAADCIRETTEAVSAENAVSACVRCHLSLDDTKINQKPQTKAASLILQCVDCHMDGAADRTMVHVASTELACLFRATGG